MTIGIRWWATTCFTLDLRSLALFRIGLGLVLFTDALTRARDTEIFYSDAGIMPREMFRAFFSRPSLYLLDGSTGFALALLLLTALVALVFVVGYRTQIASVVLWVLTLSIQNRNDWVNTGADAVMVALITWACFLPVGARFSLDARRAPARTPANVHVLSAATAALVVQMITIYFFNVVNKNTAPWWRGNAVMIALQIDEHATMIGVFVREHLQWLAKPLTYGTIFAESVPVLLLLPWKNHWLRIFSFAMLWGLHLGFAVCMYLGLFSPACMAGWLALLPSTVWDRRPLAKLASVLNRISPVAPTGVPSMARWRRVARWLVALVVLLLSAAHLGANFASTWKVRPLPRQVGQLASAIHFHQPWKMFHTPGTNDGWWVIPGKLASGREVDLYREVFDPSPDAQGAPVSYDKPDSVAHTYPTGRWRKFMMTASGKPQVRMRANYAKYLCKTWNADPRHTGDDELVQLEMVYMLEKTNQRAVALEPRPISMLTFDCRTNRTIRGADPDPPKKKK